MTACATASTVLPPKAWRAVSISNRMAPRAKRSAAGLGGSDEEVGAEQDAGDLDLF